MSSSNALLELIADRAKGRRLIVFVCGFGGAGKTTLCHNLAAKMNPPGIIFETDWYAKYPTKERRSRIESAIASKDGLLIEREENPKNWYDWSALISDLESLKESGYLELRNVWNQGTGEKDLSIDLQLPASGDSVIICDGIYLLHDEIKFIADLIILLDTPMNACLERAAARDNHRSSKQYLDYKAHLAEKYDQPYFDRFRKNAHLVIPTM